MISKILLLGILIVLIAYLYDWKGLNSNSDVIDEVIAAWNHRIISPKRPFRKVAVGVNANVDLIISGTNTLTNLNAQPAGSPRDHSVISSLDDLAECFTHFLSKGSAAERYCSSKQVADQVIAAGRMLPNAQWYVGGNAALMAQKISSAFPDIQVQLVGPVGQKLRSLLNKSLIVPKSSITKEDEVHLILEYKRDEQWGKYKAPVANRFITSHDVLNSQGTMLKTFFENIQNFKPDLVILSGLHLLEGQDDLLWNKKLDEVVMNLKKLPKSLPVHLELASMANAKFVKRILTEVVPLVSSIGLNEQELALMSLLGNGPHCNMFLKWHSEAHKLLQVVPEVTSLGLNEQEITFASEVMNGPHTSVLDNSDHPDIHKIADMVLWLLKSYSYTPSRQHSKLTRVHFHSLTYHVVGTVPNSWSNVQSAVAAGTRIAGRQACDIPELESDSVDLKIPQSFNLHTGGDEIIFNASDPVMSWTKENYFFSFSPVLICKQPLKTVGLGDAISATGLLYSQFNPDFAE